MELHVIVHGSQTVLVAHIRVFEDIVEVVPRHEALVVLCHQLRVVLVHLREGREVKCLAVIADNAVFVNGYEVTVGVYTVGKSEKVLFLLPAEDRDFFRAHGHGIQKLFELIVQAG